MTEWRILVGDVRERLADLPDASVQCCVTSPPYWGLRDYGHAGQLGLETTPDAYVARMVEVFREVRRVLRDDGTLWLNLGDSYCGYHGNARVGDGPAPSDKGEHYRENQRQSHVGIGGLKNKDLVGIPWSVAKALQAPRYTGRVHSESQRVWLAATIDAEGSICGFQHERKDDGRIRTGIHITITNTSTLMLDEANRIWPASRSEHQRPGAGHLGTMQTYRWIVHGIENKIAFLCEIYPHLIVKRGQAVIAYNMLLLMADAKRLGRSIEGDSVRERRADLMARLSRANHGSIDVPTWCVEPPTLYEPGWYLRSDIIWAKPNPMPESVTDRPTKAHEYLFLLTKAARYYYDIDAIREPHRSDTDGVNTGAWVDTVNVKHGDDKRFATRPGSRPADYFGHAGGRNKRSVWTVATQPFSGAHFAVMPEKLVEPCVLAGSRPGDLVLDPFAGAGTVGAVAVWHGRSFVGVELNPAYVEIARARIGSVAPMFSTEVA